MLVVITGLPGSGKSSVADALGPALGLPVYGKDLFKEILFDALGTGDLEWSQRLGRAAVALQYAAMRLTPNAVVDSALVPGISEAELVALDLPMVQVFCACPFDIARRRFLTRARASGARHAGHLDDQATDDTYERFRDRNRPLDLAAPLIEVDTAQPVDIAALAALVRAYA